MKPQNEPKQVETSMSLPKQAEWEKDLRSVIDAHYENYGSKESLVTSMKAVISDLLSNQEAEHKEEMDKNLDDWNKIIKMEHDTLGTIVHKLKQQHREELQDFLFEIDGFKVGGTREYILQRLESMITKLMNSQKG